MRGVENGETAGKLGQRALSDPDARVRRTCVAILAGRQDGAGLETVRAVLQHEPAVDVRRAAVNALALRAKADPAARELLLQVSQDDPSAELRELAAGVL